MTGFLLGVLSFSFGQEADQHDAFREDLDVVMDSYSRTSQEFLENLVILEKKYAAHLELNCGDKAELLRNFGRHYESGDDRTITLEYYMQKALPAAYSCRTPNYKVITQIYANIWLCYRKLGNMAGVNLAANELEKFIEEGNYGEKEQLPKLLSYLGIYYKDIGKYDVSEAYYRKSIAEYAALEIDGDKYLRPNLRLGNLLVHMRRNEEGIKQMKFVLKEAKRLDLLGKSKYSYTPGLGIESAYLDMGEYDLALEEIERLIDLCEEREYSDKLFGTLIDKASIYNKLEKYVAAISTLENQLEYLEDYSEHRQIYALQVYHTSLNKIGRIEESERYLVRALSIITDKNYSSLKDFDPAAIQFDSLGENSTYLLQTCTNIILHLRLSKYSLEDALSFIDGIDKLFATRHRTLIDYSTKLEFASEYHDFCDATLEYIFDKEIHKTNPDLAAYYISAGKALDLYEDISKRKSIPKELKVEYEKLLIDKGQALSTFEYAKKLGNHDSINVAAIRQFDVITRLQKFNEKLLNFEVDRDLRLDKETIIRQIKTSLGTEEAVFEFFYGEEMLFTYFISNDEVHFHDDSISSFLGSDFTNPFQSSSFEESDKLVADLSEYFEPFLTDKITSIRKLTIIPDGKLLYFPFDLLEYQGESLLIKFPISYQSSFLLQQYNTTKKSKANQDYVGFAMSYDEELLEKISGSEELGIVFDGNVSLAQLPNAVEEVKASASLFDSNIYLDENCTRANFQQYANDAKIVHIANHSILNEKNSNLSSIIFANDGQPDLINVLDVSPLELKADLAILSSCNSGRGNVLNGNGIRSLGQSFAHAGCPSVMVNLWEANDKSSRFIISKFNEYLKNGLTKSAALRNAKLEYIESASFRLKHPKYWANIVVIGNDDPIFKKFSFKWPAIALGAILVLGLGFFLRKKTA